MKPKAVTKNTTILQEVKPQKKEFVLNDDNAIPFLFAYAQENKQKMVRVETDFGSFVIALSENTPYHRANFIYLIKRNYFDGTFFHRVVKDFIIQGGNSDQTSTSKKRRKIGKYLLPPDTRNGLRHHRGAVSMPSSEIENPHRLASPYEFFVVQQSPGAYHLDKNYTVFGYVVEGMDVVDQINSVPTDKREWPIDNIRMKISVIDEF
ncbi:MAG: peptidylprolyl isomerase [Flavobacteriaceae bacterium]|nr:peptidylprolyl isomerase [Flavobacteriaceae bacterium]